MKRRNKVFAAAVVTTCFVATAAFSAFAAEPAVKMEGLEISSIADMSVSEFGTNNTDTGRAEHDTGHIYVGIAATDGVIDEANSNWADKAEQAEGAYTIEFNDEVEGEGFTALRAFGEGEYSVSGNLYLHDEGDGTYDSDFTGMGAAVTAANGAKVYVNGMNYLSEGIVRSFGNITGADLFVENSVLTAMGADSLKDFHDEYYNTAQTTIMISPPWVLGIQGAVRTINVLGVNSNLTIADSDITSGGWAVLSTDGCTAPYYWLYNTRLNILPESKGGMNSGWKILGYDEDAYGSGYAAFLIGSAVENFYGVSVNGATYAAIEFGGDATYQGLTAGETYEALDSATGDVIYTYTAKEDVPTTVNTVFGFLAQTAGSVNLLEGSVFNTEEAVGLYKDANVDWVFSGAELNPASGIILQMMDNDNSSIGGFDPFETYFSEEAGFPTEAYEAEVSYVRTNDSVVDPAKTYYEDAPDGGYREVAEPTDAGTVAYYEQTSPGTYGTVLFENGEYTGDIYNATGYYAQASDALDVTIAEDAVLNGDIALASHVHGMFLGDRNIDDVIAAIDEANAKHAEQKGYYANVDDIEYVFLNENGEVTENKDEAAAIQFTKFSTLEYYLVGHVINQVYYNGAASLDVIVNGTWKPAVCSLVTYLEVADGAHVYGDLTEMEDGSFAITPSENEIEPGIYGTKFVFVEDPNGSSGGESAGESAESADEASEGAESADSENGESESAEAVEEPAADAAPAEGESPEGESPEGESPEGESPEGESPEGESPTDAAPQN